jgi:nucleotide-binding universal stress UspA family protein
MIRRKTWTGFRSVLCAVDFSEHSRHALAYAAAVALRGKAALTVLYVNDSFLVAAAAVALHDRQLTARSARELQAFIDATVPPRVRARLRPAPHVSIGNPADQILKVAARCRSDLIVVATHGVNAATRLIVGSTTLDVLQRSTVPVLAIPRRARKSVYVGSLGRRSGRTPAA